jgi:hypothetical protein
MCGGKNFHHKYELSGLNLDNSLQHKHVFSLNLYLSISLIDKKVFDSTLTNKARKLSGVIVKSYFSGYDQSKSSAITLFTAIELT